ncbi:MAG: cysteine--tRNA ligase [Ruaniaceae bacterium]|nr:cysteine--tRNA ligase [Ruaniaceae bacterium]
MALHLYDSESRSVRLFEPLVPGAAGMYVCGATVQSAPHVGHMRTALTFDVLRRWLEHNGYEVTHIQNVTDIDDKILAKSTENGVPWWAWSITNEREFSAAYAALRILPPTYEPRATGHVTEMVELIGRLIERGHAYVGEDCNVYFSVSSWPEYGQLTRQKDTAQGEDEVSDKRDQRDFALWKTPKQGEPESASWPTPWGRGRPGWHLECSAMARRYLGETFDIHGGGLDLRFPHHENERAQSTAAGWGFVRYWVHSAWVTQSGEKMSKSLGNSLSAAEVLDQHPAPVVRLALIAAHYRTMMEFSDVTLAEAASNWERFVGFVERAVDFAGSAAARVDLSVLPLEFVEAMDDDLSTPAAFAAIHEHVRRGNIALTHEDHEAVAEELGAVRAMLRVLGLDPLDWVDASSSSSEAASFDSLVQALLDERISARESRDWARADSIRDQLAAAGILVEDGVDGARWHVKGH